MIRTLLRILSRGSLPLPPPMDLDEIECLKRELEKTRLAARRLREELQWEQTVGGTLHELFGPLISPDSTIQEMANIVLERARSMTGSTHGYVSAIDSATGDDVWHTHTEMRDGECGIPENGGGVAFPKGSDGDYGGLWGYALNTGRPFFTNSPATHPASSGPPLGHISVARFLSVPVMLDGEPAGQIALANPESDYTEHDLDSVRRLAGFYALALQRKESQERTDAALREKEVLLREIHHRVKNNLQVICSLLNLQAGCIGDPKALEMLKESQNRVRSMAMVHEQLHRSRDLSKINLGEYVRNLAASLFCSYGVDSATIALRVEVEDISLAIDTAIPCGLIIQELVSNSIKYAFPGGRRGEIHIGLRSLPNNSRLLIVRDTGVGLPPHVDIQNTKSLGLRLVRILAEQTEATVTCSRDGGTEFRITFGQASNEEGD